MEDPTALLRAGKMAGMVGQDGDTEGQGAAVESPPRPGEKCRRATTDGAASSSQARGCLELSKANLSLVEDLFRLSIALLRAGTATLQSQNSEPGATPSD